MVIILFLGNPGRQYLESRHNVGWRVCDAVTSHLSPAWKTKFHAEYAEAFFSGAGKAILCRPQTFMNRSGITAREIVSFYKADCSSLIVVHDDLETPFGTVTFQHDGGLGGHNGLKSIKGELGRQDFFRLKVGIGRPARQSVSSYVLGQFTPDEEISLNYIIDTAARMLESALSAAELPNQKVTKTVSL